MEQKFSWIRVKSHLKHNRAADWDKEKWIWTTGKYDQSNYGIIYQENVSPGTSIIEIRFGK